jgi:ABC-2 type transport system permease protein
MSNSSTVISGARSDSRPAPIPWTRQLYWSLRRELWETRSIIVAPLAVAALFLFGFLISMFFLPQKMRDAAAFGLAKQHELLAQPYLLSGGAMMLVTLAVGLFYCLDALYGERRDRSILFWKSLPVSDVITVLSKFITPIIFLPLITFAVAVAMQSIMLLLSTAVLMGSGLSAAPLWTHAAVLQLWVMLLYHLVTVHGLWYAPVYGWLLLVSASARRTPILWAAVPLLAVGVVERIAFNTSYVGSLLLHRLVGGGANDDNFMTSGLSVHPLTHFNAGPFFVSPGLWIGLAVAAAFLAFAVRVRRYQGPM